MCRIDSSLKSLGPWLGKYWPRVESARLLQNLSLVGSWVFTHHGLPMPFSWLSACKSLETALRVGRKHGWNGSWAGRQVRVLRRLCWQLDLFGFLLRLLQEFYDFTPKGLLHCLVHILEGLVFFLDTFFNGICICLDWSFRLCAIFFLWNLVGV
jgi:hypothetical protein